MAPSATCSSSVPTLFAPSSSTSGTIAGKDEFDVISAYHNLLASDSELPFPIAAIFALSELVSKSKAATTTELMENIRSASQRLKSSLENPVPATAGLDLFTRFVVTKSWDSGDDFEAHKASLAALAHEFATHTVPSCREKICELVLPFIKDDSVVLTHSYSRVVMQALKFAALHQRKRISVYVTESRPHGLGLKTYKQLMNHGIPCTVILDSAVAYTMPKVDLVLTGAEGVVESGGFLNAVGTYGMAIIAKACNKPFFALAESFKFLRMFPLSQFDLPTNNTNRNLLAFPDLDSQSNDALTTTTTTTTAIGVGEGAQQEDDGKDVQQQQDQHDTPKLTQTEMISDPTRATKHHKVVAGLGATLMSRQQELINPAIDYTTPDLVTFLFSDVGVLTPSGVGDALLAVYGGAD
ncbi:related to GCN3 - translation initiation factor eIF2B, 34 KD, alpha subunit [Melanopsichium pennsylvanicum]|uniref:Translation initiation factor eIF2B subunit alpha n=2 Tax=Melanopsichium pennsylvanicum TaxID=63383 RepID=A0AAJ4XMP6_9BASI|nr:related to GCN3-translation initiation factor eIF2B, 34 KD, alpha subunit [Melanopsichium pennsylvanicum 4]SNX85087.1 related to GCN3 - translation initiation factor eIF2B, 34 KD, alpha subunit [Melanopsichium pennsylvanicum]